MSGKLQKIENRELANVRGGVFAIFMGHPQSPLHLLGQKAGEAAGGKVVRTFMPPPMGPRGFLLPPTAPGTRMAIM